jgi:hypothetical protein
MLTLADFDEAKFQAAIERAQLRANVKSCVARVKRLTGSRQGVDRLGDRAYEETYLASERGVCAKLVPGYHPTWRSLRLRCPECESYLVECRVAGGKFAGCAVDCGFNLRWPLYLDEKHKAVRAHLCGEESPWPCLLLDEQRRPVESHTDRWFNVYTTKWPRK